MEETDNQRKLVLPPVSLVLLPQPRVVMVEQQCCHQHPLKLLLTCHIAAPKSNQQCPNCLVSFTTQEVGLTTACVCGLSQEWSKNISICPVAQHVEAEVLLDLTFCRQRERDHEDCILLCDTSNHGYHLECLNPPMNIIPLEVWLCTNCILFYLEAIDYFQSRWKKCDSLRHTKE
jgi:hypothetical protein